MRLLALDTTTRGGSAAMIEDGRVVAERAGDAARSHAERLPGELIALLDDRGVAASAVDVFAVAAGPGSFTGLRVGIATMQGLAFVHGRRMVTVSALETIAQAASADLRAGTIVGAWMDAHRRDVFSALYQVADAPPFSADRLIELDAAAVAPPEETLGRWQRRWTPAVFAGDGAVLYGALLNGHGIVVAPPLLAGPMGRVAFARAHGGDTIDPAAVRPLYVRRPDAEVARERAGQPQSTPETSG